MELNLAKRIIDACDNAGVEARIREEYSGRNMFGKTTTGVIVQGLTDVESLTDTMAAIISFAHEFIEYVEDGLVDPEFQPTGFNTDSIGRDVIIY